MPDTFPNEPATDGCHYIPLPPEPGAPTPGPTPIVVSLRMLDELGDAPAGRDIIEVSTTVAADTLTLEVILADDWPTDSWRLAFISWLVDGRPYEGATGFSAGSCNPYIATYGTVIARGGRLEGSLEVPAGTRAEIDGARLLLVLPLEALDDPHILGIEISTPDGDTFPDEPASDGCHYIPLTPET